jgi:hypothetical protein
MKSFTLTGVPEGFRVLIYRPTGNQTITGQEVISDVVFGDFEQACLYLKGKGLLK